MELDTSMTYSEWQQRGGGGIGHRNRSWLCSVLDKHEKELDALTLADLFGAPSVGVVVERVLRRFYSEHGISEE